MIPVSPQSLFSYYPITGSAINTSKPVDWLTVPKNLAFQKTPFDLSNGAYGWSTQNEVQPYLDAQQKAVQVGNERWKKISDLITYFGPPIIQSFVTAGVIKSAQGAANGNIDSNAFDDLFNRTGGDLSKVDDSNNRSANILGVPASYWVVGLAVFLVYVNYFKDSNKSKSK